ncbi:hypothetical protein PGT21_012515 [Puccinia graminis f. sp. tritici]|uniref:Uncharacterized protein n=1 Tax=Puccinia graminis f. sp. tritici TaxID=56615 RepID=A0A5B0R255_PUCGR|nr:hypothetical protein PGT21_012515 [Puccinia graminis f. sp. tritici]
MYHALPTKLIDPDSDSASKGNLSPSVPNLKRMVYYPVSIFKSTVFCVEDDSASSSTVEAKLLQQEQSFRPHDRKPRM